MLLLQLCNAGIKGHIEQAQLISQYDITCYYVTSDSDLGLLYRFYCHGFAFSNVVLAGVEFILLIVSGMRIYELVFWIYDRNSVDNAEVFPLLLSSAYTMSKPFLLLTPPRVGWVCTESYEGTQLG